jgi:two-component system, sensor histidine kinase PdtaS
MTIQERSAPVAPQRPQGFKWFNASGIDALRKENTRLRTLLSQAEDAASRSEMMLREGDHRIKNSLQIVSGLIHLQARREESPSASLALRAAAARIQSIARIHDALQASHGQNVVELGAVLETMCLALEAMAGDPLSVEVIVHVEPFQAPVSLAQPIVLAVNELVVNALRHAFPDGRTGTVLVSMIRVDNDLHVVVADDGVGAIEANLDGRGYGMTLVRAMAKQVGARLTVENKGGARFTLVVPAPEVMLSPVS